MYLLVSVLTVIVSIILIFFVVIQNSKGGGLAAGFSSSNQVMGVRKTTDFLEKATWGLAGAIVLLSIIASLLIPNHSTVQDSSIKNEIQNVTNERNTIPDFGTAVPQQGQGNEQPAAPATAPAPTTAPATTPTAPSQPAK